MLALALAVLATLVAHGQGAPPPAAGDTFTVFVQARQIGQETVSITRQADGWLLRGTNRLAAPLDVTTRSAEVHYDLDWRPTRVQVDNITRGQQVMLKTTFANGQATTALDVGGQVTSATTTVAPDTIVLLNNFVGSYAALARRLPGRAVGDTLRGFVVPQNEVELRIQAMRDERIETPRRVISARRYLVAASAPAPLGDLQLHIWTESDGALLRLSVPAQALELARDDIASAAARTTAFSLPNDESVRIPASGFGLAASVVKPAAPTAPALPALILVGPSSAPDRDGVVAGIPVIGQLAGGLSEAGFVVVRYDRRGGGQTGGRAETATLVDYAEDVRAIVTWLEKTRKDVDRRRIGVVGYGDGAWVAMQAAARDRRIAALALVAAASGTGSDLVLEQQRLLLERLKTPDADREAKIALQKQINTAVITGGGWEGVPDEARRAADSPYFQSFLTFDVARVMRDIRQPVLVAQGTLDTHVPPHHAERIAELARARKRKVAVDLASLPGLNHLLVPAVTGDVDEYLTLPDRTVAPSAIAAVSSWMARELKGQ